MKMKRQLAAASAAWQRMNEIMGGENARESDILALA